MPERLEIRVHGEAGMPTLIYLPGLHGDWTLIGGFRKQLFKKVRFVEMTYPRTCEWTLDGYAEAIERGLKELGINGGWLLGESFGSQVLWAIAQRARLQIDGIILAGGFVRYPWRLGVRIAEGICGGIPVSVMSAVLFGYARIARFRFRHSPETRANIDEFIARRTEADRQAATHRLRLIGLNDPRDYARRLTIPLYGMSGFFDAIVPWPFVVPWLKKQCPALREYKLIYRADHTVLATAPRQAAQAVFQWMLGTGA